MAKADLYKISMVDGKVLVRIPPQLLGAETANLDDVQAELHLMDVDYIPEQLLEIYNRTSGDFDFLTDFDTTDFTLQIFLSDDEAQAFFNIIPPKEEHEPMTVERVMNALKEHGVYQGIDQEKIQQAITERIYYEPILIASGKSAINGNDGYPELLFLPEKSRPKLGTRVDLREVPVLQQVKEGQELVRLELASMGQDGFSITGKLLTATSGKPYRIQPGRNTRYNKEGTHIIATKDGAICQKGNSISVEDIKVIDKVDASTGHIRFDGVVKVKGNISDRCSVEGVRIDVGGSVGKARLRSIGEIRVGQGLMGSIVQCGTSLRANNITDTQATVGEHAVVDEFIVNSKIYCGSTLQVVASHGYVTGGVLQAGNLIKVPKVGLPTEQELEAEEEPEVEEDENENKGPQTLMDVGISLKNRKLYNSLYDQARESFYGFEDALKEVTSIMEELKEGWNEDKIDVLGDLEKSITKGVNSIYADLLKRRTLGEINELNRATDGGMVFITGSIETGTAINVRRSRYNVLTKTSAMVYHSSLNGVQVSPCDKLLKQYEKYFINLPV